MKNQNIYYKTLNILPSSEKFKGIILLLATLITSVLEAAGISLILPILTLVVDGNLNNFNYDLEGFFENINIFGEISLIAKIFILLVIIYVIKNIYLVIYYYCQNKYSLNIYKLTSTKLYNLYLNSNISYHFDKNSAVLIRNVLVECKNYSSVVNTFIKLLSESAIFTAIVITLLILRPLETSFALIVMGLSVLILYMMTNKRVERWGLIRQETTGDALKSLQQGLQAIKDVKLKNCQKIFTNKYNFHINEFVKSAYKHNTITELPKIWLEIIFIIFLPLVLVISSLSTTNLDLKDMIPTLGLFVAAVFKLMPSIYRIYSSFQSISFDKVAIEKLYEEFNSANLKTKESPDLKKLQLKFENEISLEDIDYKYPTSKNFLIKNFSLEIKKNEILGIIGKSGVGKSTLVDLITGLIEPNNGSVKVDGSDIKKNTNSWHKMIGYIPASCYLLDDTIRNNIAFGIDEKNIDDNRIIKAAKEAQIYGSIVKLDKKFDTIIGERGIKLSDGQKQRIGIARELYRNNPILIFDEATSTLDINTENEILTSLDNFKKSKTILIVSHRENTIKICDRVINLYANPYLKYNEEKK